MIHSKAIARKLLMILFSFFLFVTNISIVYAEEKEEEIVITNTYEVKEAEAVRIEHKEITEIILPTQKRQLMLFGYKADPIYYEENDVVDVLINAGNVLQEDISVKYTQTIYVDNGAAYDMAGWRTYFSEYWNGVIERISEAYISGLEDYALHSLNEYTPSIRYSSTYPENGKDYAQFEATINMHNDFLPTKQQEAEFNSALLSTMRALNLSSLSDYEKIKACYDFVTSNVKYAYDAEGKASLEAVHHTAYSALLKKEAVCQGYALLLYRMLKYLGIDVRYGYGVGRNSIGQSEAHGWNIVQLEGKYYYLDSTWDAGRSEYHYFLKGTRSFHQDHYLQGPTDLTISVEDYQKKNVNTISVTQVTLTPKEDRIYVGDDLKLEVKVLPENATNKKVTYSSSNAGIATVDAYGKVHGVSAGKATIFAISEEGNRKASMQLEVVAPSDYIYVESLNAKDMDMELNEGKKQIPVSILPTNATNKTLVYISHNKDVATIDEKGIITPLKTGTAKIEIISSYTKPIRNPSTNTNSFIPARVVINVVIRGGETIPLQSLTMQNMGEDVNHFNINVLQNKRYLFNVVALPTNATNKRVTWSSSDTQKAIVDEDGMVTVLGNSGSVRIYASSKEDPTIKTWVELILHPEEVQNIKVTSLNIINPKTALTVGDTATNTIMVTPTNATNQNVTWSSSNTSVATVDQNGKVTAKAVGTATITATAKDGSGKSISYEVTVKAKTVSVTGIKLNKTSTTLTVGNTETLLVTVEPSNATNKNVTWSSSDTKVATVDSNGKVTAKAAGTTTITAKSNDGNKTATTKVTVKAATVNVSGVTINNPKISLTVGDSATNTITITPSNATNKDVTWSSSNTSVATVDQNGKVTAKAVGTATITATAKDGSGKSTSYEVTVKAKEEAKQGCPQGNDNITNFVIRLYELCLNRCPDASGLKYWSDALQSGKQTAAGAAKGFFESNEMKNLKLSNEEFIKRCYRVMMNREADNSGKAYWMDRLAVGMSRLSVVKGFVGSTEFTKICNSYGIEKGDIHLTENRDFNYGVTAFITRCFKSVLGRGYDVSGLNYWTGRIMESTNKKEAAVNAASSGFFNSNEFKNKGLNDADFIKVCYRTFLDREADTSGLNYWLTQMPKGKDVILRGFANSNEFNAIMARYGIR